MHYRMQTILSVTVSSIVIDKVLLSFSEQNNNIELVQT